MVNILQETTMRMCSAEESAAYPVMENQLCVVGSGGTSAYRVNTDIFFVLTKVNI